jgi:uncharacterized protein YndB with AHSA1/START domain
MMTMKHNISNEQSINIQADKAKVWDALTRPELIKQYFFGTYTTTDWQPGSEIIFEGEWEGKQYRDKGTVLEYKEGKMLKYNYWSSMSGIEDKPENYAVITYRVSGEDGNVTLTITQENIPDEKMKKHSAANWKTVMEGLKKLVEEDSPSYA